MKDVRFTIERMQIVNPQHLGTGMESAGHVCVRGGSVVSVVDVVGADIGFEHLGVLRHLGIRPLGKDAAAGQHVQPVGDVALAANLAASAEYYANATS